MRPCAPQLEKAKLLDGLEFGLLTGDPARGLGDLQALPCPQSGQVRLNYVDNSAIMARMLNSNRATGSVRSCTELADLQLHAGSGEFSSPMSRASGR